MDTFEGENMQTQYNVLGYRIDLYFHEHKLAIEIYEGGHEDRSIDYEIKIKKASEKELGCKFIRIDPDKENFNIRKNIFACLFSVHNTISLSRHEQVCLMKLLFERYFSHHRAM